MATATKTLCSSRIRMFILCLENSQCNWEMERAISALPFAPTSSTQMTVCSILSSATFETPESQTFSCLAQKPHPLGGGSWPLPGTMEMHVFDSAVHLLEQSHSLPTR